MEWLWLGDGSHNATVGRDAFAVLPEAKPALRAASRSEVQDIAPRRPTKAERSRPFPTKP